MKRTSQEQMIHVTIRNRERIVTDDWYSSLSSTNEVGTFDILPKHENFITLIDKYVTLRKADGSKEDIKISQGVIKVVGNDVTIFLDILSQATGDVAKHTVSMPARAFGNQR